MEGAQSNLMVAFVNDASSRVEESFPQQRRKEGGAFVDNASSRVEGAFVYK